MSNYMATTTAGTSRRRAKTIIIHNPAVPQNMPAESQPPVGSVTFVMEDRIIMADGSEVFKPVGNMVVPLNAKTLSKLYPLIDAEAGTVDSNNTRYGAQIMQIIVQGLVDVFITEGTERDGQTLTEYEPPIA